MKKIFLHIMIGCIVVVGISSCSKNSFDSQPLTETDPGIFAPKPFNINNINDTYGNIASYAFTAQWGSYNLHDPSIMKEGDWYYCFSTDVAYGQPLKPGIMVRRSKDLVDWEFRGWAIGGLPQQAVNYIKSINSTYIANDGIWAPYIMKVGSEFRLYYSLASNGFRVSAIGLLTATSLDGPWTEKGLAVTSKTVGAGTNAIDPTIVVTPTGEQYMYYGSAWDGLFVVKLNPSTGLAQTPGDLGTRIVRRGKTNGVYNGNLEAPEIIYNATQKKYYLFVSYDWIDTKYNVRVFRADNPTGPFVDWNGENADVQSDHADQIVLGPYAFKGHAGWQGTGHCTVFKNEKNEYFMASQGRPAVDKFFMDMHVRKMFWAENGWPMVSPERYANVPQTPVTRDELVGEYEQVIHGYVRVPGYADTQTNPNINFALPNNPLLNANGTIFGDPNNTWVYDPATSRLEMRWVGGLFVDRLQVARERDWEKKKETTIIMTGYNGGGLGLWFKKVK
ncbi:MAG: arabinan endo-1,5-alpha-L-arabinosidase [Sphingobacteriales bacterium]|jgi:arabinan endo-1,5-alpha-L-arabinosidase|nr:arabinan endo-1,5-alpha-L-arabinosidase [Sphingobacteriales bacterium]